MKYNRMRRFRVLNDGPGRWVVFDEVGWQDMCPVYRTRQQARHFADLSEREATEDDL